MCITDNQLTKCCRMPSMFPLGIDVLWCAHSYDKWMTSIILNYMQNYVNYLFNSTMAMTIMWEIDMFRYQETCITNDQLTECCMHAFHIGSWHSHPVMPPHVWRMVELDNSELHAKITKLLIDLHACLLYNTIATVEWFYKC